MSARTPIEPDILHATKDENLSARIPAPPPTLAIKFNSITGAIRCRVVLQVAYEQKQSRLFRVARLRRRNPSDGSISDAEVIGAADCRRKRRGDTSSAECRLSLDSVACLVRMAAQTGKTRQGLQHSQQPGPKGTPTFFRSRLRAFLNERVAKLKPLFHLVGANPGVTSDLDNQPFKYAPECLLGGLL